MDHCHQRYVVRESAVQMQPADNTCHINLDPGSGEYFDIEAVWCSLCQRPRFGDDVCTDICVCTSFTNSIGPWLQQPGDENAFKNLQASNYDAVDSWLHSPVDDNADQNLQTSHYDAMMDFSTLHTRTGLYTLSQKDMSSSGTSETSATSATSTSPPYERRSPEAGHPDWPQYHRTMSSKLKRREQNRNSQRNFRERKNQMTKDLQDRVEELIKLNEQLNHEVSALRTKNSIMNSMLCGKSLGGSDGKIA